MALPQFQRHVPDDPPEPVEGLADLDHAQAQGVVPDLLHQLVDGQGGLQQPGVLGGAGGGVQGLGVGRGAGDHQLAHQVDQAVQLVGRDLHHLEFLGLAVLELLLLLQGGGHHRRGHGVLLDDDGAEHAPLHRAALQGFLRLDPQGLLQFVAGQAAAGHQDLAQEPVLLGQFLDQLDVVFHLGMGRDQPDLAVLPHELEHVLEGGPVGRGIQLDLQAHSAFLGIEGLPLREVAEQGGQVHDLAQGGQVADERERIHAVAQDVPGEPDGDVPAVAAGAVRRGGPGRLGLGQAAGQVGREPFEDEVALGPGFRGLGQVGLQVGDEPGQVVVAVQHEADQAAGELQGVAAGPVQDALHDVREAHDMVQPEQAGGALDGVHRPEHGVDRFSGVGVVLQGEQGLLHGGQQFPGFDDVGLFRLVEVHGLIPGWRSARGGWGRRTGRPP